MRDFRDDLDEEMRGRLEDLEGDFRAWAAVSTRPDDDRPAWTKPATDGLLAYINRVLPVEKAVLDLVEASLPDPGGTLVLTVGTSPQPLLVSVAWWRPARVLLAPSKTGSSPDFAVLLKEMVLTRHTHLGLSKKPDVQILEGGLHPTDPAEALHSLRRWLRDLGATGPDVRIDITGGKKTMAATAFALASELCIEAVYLDGIDYDERVGLPWPGTLRVRTLPDPSSVLGLARASEGRRFFEACRYLEAESAFGEVAHAWETWGEPAERERFERAGCHARACQAWMSAEYDKAMECFQALGTQVPLPVRRLGSTWAAWTRGDPGNLSAKLRDDDRLLPVYLVDAWRWVDRWAAGQPRDAYLRWFGLGEFAMEALAVRLRREGALTVVFADDTMPGELSDTVLVRLIGGASGMATLLGEGGPIARTWRPRFGTAARDEVEVQMGLDGALDIDGLSFWLSQDNQNLRNACAHKLAQVSPGRAREAADASRALILSTIAAWPNACAPAGKTLAWFDSSAFEPPQVDGILDGAT